MQEQAEESVETNKGPHCMAVLTAQRWEVTHISAQEGPHHLGGSCRLSGFCPPVSAELVTDAPLMRVSKQDFLPSFLNVEREHEHGNSELFCQEQREQSLLPSAKGQLYPHLIQRLMLRVWHAPESLLNSLFWLQPTQT